MADSNTTVIIDVTLNSADANQRAKDLGASIKTIKEGQKELKASGKETDVAYQSNAQNLRLLNAEQKAYIQISNAAEGSNNQLRAQLALLTQQYNGLAKAERDDTTAGKALTIQIKAISDELKKNESAVGDNRRNVGNYKDALGDANQALKDQKSATSALTNEVNRLPIGFQQAGAAIKGVTSQVQNFRVAQQQAKEAQIAYTEAQQISVSATEAANAATERATVIGFKYAQGEATETAVLAANTAATDANIVATAAQTAATEAQVVATSAATNATKVFKIALASTGIGAIVIIVAALAAYLSKFDPIMDKVEQAFAAVGAIINRVTGIVVDFFSNISSLGDFLSKIGDIIAHPIDSFNKLATEINNAATAAIALKKAQQDLEDQVKIQEVSNARAIQQVKELTLQARNRSLSEAERQNLLKKAAKIDDDNFKKQQSIADKKRQLAIEDIKIQGNLTDEQVKRLDKEGLAYAFQLKDLKNITDEQVDVLKEAELEKIKNLEETTNRQEKNQNLQDALAEKAQAAAEKRAERAKKLREEANAAEQARLESVIKTNESIQTERKNEEDSVNLEIDEKVAKYKKYGQTTAQLELERTARLKAINVQYQKDVAKSTEEVLQATEDLMISRIRDRDVREISELAVQNQRKLAAQDELIAATQERINKGEQGLTDLLKAQQDLRGQILLQGELDINEKQNAIRAEQSAREIEFAQATKEAKQKIRDEDIELAQQALDLIGGIFDKQTQLGKAAFLAEKAFAVARIIIKTQESIAANQAATQIANVSLAAVPVAGPFLVIANNIKAQAERTRIIVQGAISTAAVIATAIQGFSTGGVFESDGRGAVLPGYSRRDNTNAKLRSGEAVIVAEAARDPKALSALSAINVAYGGRPLGPGYAMANGGVYEGGFTRNISNDVTGTADVANLVVSALRNVNVVTDVRDILTALQRNNATAVNKTL